jgi:hypothetical protein
MNTNDRNLALDLAAIDIDDRAELVSFLAIHVLNAARAIYHMPASEPGEEPGSLDAARSAYAQRGDNYYGIEVSTALFDRFIGPCVLFARLFPGALWDARRLETTLNVPQWAYFEDSLELAHFLWSDLEALVTGLFGGPSDPVHHAGLAHILRPRRNNEGLAELWDARDLARKALRPATDPNDPLYRRRSIGLRVMDAETTWLVDEVLRANAHLRLIWFAAQDVSFPIAQTVTGADGKLHLEPPDHPDAGVVLTDDHGVFATVVPETIKPSTSFRHSGASGKWAAAAIAEAGCCYQDPRSLGPRREARSTTRSAGRPIALPTFALGHMTATRATRRQANDAPSVDGVDKRTADARIRTPGARRLLGSGQPRTKRVRKIVAAIPRKGRRVSS